MASILIIDDEEVFARNAAKYLGKFGHGTLIAFNGRNGLESFTMHQPDIVVLDYRLPDMDGVSIIRTIREQDHDVPILMITGHGSIELAVDAMKAGANDLLTKPVSLAELRQRIEAFSAHQKETGRLRYFERKERYSTQTILGSSAEMKGVRDRLARIAGVDGVDNLPPVLIFGETGTGKELIARALHFESVRADRPFIEINCAAIPDNLLESELFGHERGAFTDAKERKIGLLEAADSGTLFLDEIGEMNLGLQAKLLKVIEDGRFRRVGSLQERQVNLRIVAATNQNLETRIKQGEFRADLFFRLGVLKINVPPLRERNGDVALLAEHFLAQSGKRYRRSKLRLSAEAKSALCSHHWPGNVRELRNVMEQAVLLCHGDEITPHDLTLPVARSSLSSLPANQAGNSPDDASCSLIDAAERELIARAMQYSAGNVTKASKELGISRDTLRYRLEKHGLR